MVAIINERACYDFRSGSRMHYSGPVPVAPLNLSRLGDLTANNHRLQMHDELTPARPHSAIMADERDY